jgi:hypothetical protein
MSTADTVCKLFEQNPKNRPLLRAALHYAANDLVPLAELESHIQAQPSFGKGSPAPFFIVDWLDKAGALERYELDADGQIVDRNALADLSDDEIDDVVASYAYRATPDGLEALTSSSATARLAELLEQEPDRADTYLEILAYLREKHPLADVMSLLAGRDVLTAGRDADQAPLSPSLFVDKLSAVGAVAYSDHGWKATKEGEEALEELL